MTDIFSIAQGNGFYNPPCAFEVEVPSERVALPKSPKSMAFPSVDIVM